MPATIVPQGAPPGLMSNPALAQDPDYLRKVLETQRRARLADMLTQQGAAPIEYDPKGRISWTQGLAKMLQAGLGGKLGQDNIGDQAGMMAQGAQAQMGQNSALASALERRQQPQGPSAAQQALSSQPNPAAGPTNAAAALMPPPGAGTAGAPAGGLGDIPHDQMTLLIARAQQGDPASQEILKAVMAAQQPTNTQKEARDPLLGSATVQKAQMDAAGSDVGKLQILKSHAVPGSAAERQIQAAIDKANYVAPAEVKAGNFALDKDNKPIMYNPGFDKGIRPGPLEAGADGVLMPSSASATPGYAGAASGIEGAVQGAKTNNSVFSATGPKGQPLTVRGSAIPGGGGAPQGVAPGAPPAAPQQQRFPPGSPPQAVPPGAGPSLPGLAGPDPTVQSARAAASDFMSKDFQSQLQKNAASSGTINNLQQIMSLANGARTGQLSDHMRLVDSVLSMMGSQDATQRQIAGDLLGKNSAQIVARLGNGDMGTDAARQILMSAYPNAHMMAQSIAEASQNLIAQQHREQARAQVLAPHFASQDAPGYIKKASDFDVLADPRIFQWKAMPPGDDKNKYRAAILAQDPSLMDKAKALQAMGVQ